MILNKGLMKNRERIEISDVLLNSEELENHAKSIAKGHSVTKKLKTIRAVANRLNHNFETIASVYEYLNQHAQNKRNFFPASEWLLDNFYKIEEQVKVIRQEITKKNFLDLNVLDRGFLKGFPRSYAIGLELVSHTDGCLDDELIVNFVKAYQTHSALSISELWSLSFMIRVALVEKIRNICEMIHSDQHQWENVEKIFEKDSEKIFSIIKESLERMQEIDTSYIHHLLRKLRSEDIDSGEIMDYIEKKLLEFNVTTTQIIDWEHKEQASRKISIGNAIISLNAVSKFNWNDIFETLCIPEKILREDPAGVYERMDFESRDYYRNHIEEIGKKCNISEIRVARRAVEYAKEACQKECQEKQKHVGYYIIGKGRKLILQDLRCKKSSYDLQADSFLIYLAGVISITGLLAILLGFYAYNVSYSIFKSILVGIITLIPASEIAVLFMNWLIIRIFPPSFLPKLEYQGEIPEEAATMVVIPALLTNAKSVEELLRRLEVYYLGNKEKNIFFGLAGDFKDGKNEKEPEDENIVNAAVEGVSKLNEKYARDGDIFFYFHRHRQYNEKQQLWMGWERKRGALAEFNELLLGAKGTSYSIIVGDISRIVKKIRYVITLDADTRLYLDVAKKLIGTIAHPLNRPVFDSSKGIVTDGYGLIQPRIGIDVNSAGYSTFTKIYAGQGGIDSYTTAVSDVYQDLTGEGIFTGKGIYDLEIFTKALRTAIPDNTVLSHDLLEGSYVRTGLATDIELIDGYPGKYNSFMMRLHRWTRGDWQLIGWLRQTVKDCFGNNVKNPLSIVSKWKIFDNMRRSLVSVSLTIFFLLGLIIFPGPAWVWLGFGFLVLILPLLLEGLSAICTGFQYNGRTKKINGNIIYGSKGILYQSMLQLIFLPYNAYMMSDAIVRTLYRLFVSRKNFLEWTTAADVERKLKNDLISFIKRMRVSIVIALVILVLVLSIKSQNIGYALPLIIAWAISPAIAHKISKEDKPEKIQLREEDNRTLRRIARKTWAYYEDFAGEEDNYLPADNYQENPPNGVAHRTSPTNIGFLLLSILTARDLGYITTGKMLEQLNNTLATIEKLETWKGHLYNWYNTKTLEILRPMYISTVDSGNFIGYLITLKQGLLEYLKKPILDKNLIYGLKDTFDLIDEKDRPDIDFSTIINQEKITLFQWREFVDNAIGAKPLSKEDACDILQITYNKNFKVGCIAKINWAKKFQNMLEDLHIEIDRLFIYYIPQHDKEGALQDLWRELRTIEENISITELAAMCSNIMIKIEKLMESDDISKENKDLLQSFKEKIERIKNNAEMNINEFYNLILRLDTIIEETDFTPLYDPKKNLFSIGYDVHENILTNSYYDLLASEARLASYIAIIKKQVPKIHWQKLGRALTVVNDYKGLVSWTGTMFEYFMPLLVLKNYKNTLLNETYATVIRAQKQYGKNRNVPWGTSESGYYAFDRHLNYQYKAFGVPDLGLKRGLIDDMVISPYSAILALPVDPNGVMENINVLVNEGIEGAYGFYEAIDYTPGRLVHGQRKEIVRNFMAHHQGMNLLALNNYLNDNCMQERFHADPAITSGEILLQEKIPVKAIITKEYKEPVKPLEIPKREEIRLVRKYNEPKSILPRCHILSNGKYSIMVTDAGSGYSKIEGMQVTRWREDKLSGSYGTFIFLKNIQDNKVWSSAFDPIYTEPDGYQVNFSLDKAEFFRTDENIDTHTEIVVSPEDNVEIRKVSLHNHGNEAVLIELTSYLETVLTFQNADVAHPAFSNLFIRTEAIEQYGGLIASRRPRVENNDTVWAMHMSVVEGEEIGHLQYETNRGNFIGRGKDISDPVALSKPLTNTAGAVLDPIMSLRRRVKINPGEKISIYYMTGIANSRDEVMDMLQKYHDLTSIERAFQLAYTRSQMEMAYLNLKAEEIEKYQDMISHLIYLSPCRNKYEHILKQNNKGQSSLWAYGISGDYPIVLVSLKQEEEIDIVIDALKAHEYWRMKGLTVDLVILNEDESNYLQPLQQLLQETVKSKYGSDMQDRPGGIFIRDANAMLKEDVLLLYSVARIVLKGEAGSIRSQIRIEPDTEKAPKEKEFMQEMDQYISKDKQLNLHYFNEYGGFEKDGKEYVIRLKEGMHTPAPWLNVIANKEFGFTVTESGSGFTWAENSRENKLTPWSNDPVSDPIGEMIYLRDEDCGTFWSVTPLPVRQQENYTIYHGLGYSRFEHHSYGLAQELTLFVSQKDPIKISLLKLKNDSQTTRKLTLTYYIRPVMGVSEENTQPYLITEMDEDQQVFTIRNPYSMDFPNRVAFIASSDPIQCYTGDREEFIGVKRTLKNPAALKREGLSNRVGAGFDPCAAIQISIEIEPEEEKECIFLIGQAQDMHTVYELVEKHKNVEYCKDILKQTQNNWKEVLGTIQVKTPDLSMDLLLNNWLMYQNIVCRQWARSAFYQSGGAYGFRDQLQDAMNSVLIRPQILEEQIMLHSAHQFLEGDVQHWWHPGAGEKGIRTRFSDDLLWLPLAIAEYVEYTGDSSILTEEIHFLKDAPLKDDEDERYGIPSVSDEKASIYEHCIRAIERSLRFGEHGIPLMGSGDWNDGMSTVGNKGKGESIWLGWFLATILSKFKALCKMMNDTDRGDRYARISAEIVEAIEENGWDGSWYRRAYFDNGTPLGSIENEECTIDSLAQSWAVISGLGRKDRAKEAMESVERHLIRWDAGMILLFTPPFDKSDLHPGYIKGYVPGVRENGGQYTHAAIWVINAFALMGDGDKAWKLYNMINPINHTRTSIECAVYKVEPYAIAADVYAIEPHVGRGGWTWYTGAAGWMYRVGLEYILGFQKKGDRLIIQPCTPKDWKEYSIQYRYLDTNYHITVKNPENVNGNVKSITIDGYKIKGKEIRLTNDGKPHDIEVILG